MISLSMDSLSLDTLTGMLLAIFGACLWCCCWRVRLDLYWRGERGANRRKR